MSTAKVSLDVLIFVLLAEMRKQDKEVSQDGKQNTGSSVRNLGYHQR